MKRERNEITPPPKKKVKVSRIKTPSLRVVDKVSNEKRTAR